MKPISLNISNIGPFVGEHVIDFTILDNIYVITGKTGSGKTTILDCITYALYGRLPGSKANPDRRHLRSDFCAKNDISTLSFDFLLNGNTYRVERTLPYSKIKKNGTQTQADEQALLSIIEKSKNTTQNDLFTQDMGLTLLENQKAKVDEKIESLLLLSIDEFTRIVLLPQGEFATFLKQNSKEKKSLLLKLFPIEIFSQIIEKIKEKKTLEKASYDEIFANIERIKASFDPKTAEEERTHLENEIQRIKALLDARQETIAKLRIEKEKLITIQEKFAHFDDIEKQRNSLIIQNEDILQLEKKVAHSTEVEKLVPLSNDYIKYSKELANFHSEKQECSSKLAIAKNDKENLLKQENEFAELTKSLPLLDVLIHELQRCLELQKTVDIVSGEYASLLQELQVRQDEKNAILAQKKEFDELLKNEKSIQSEHEKILAQIKKFSHEILLAKSKILDIEEDEARIAYESAKQILDVFNKELEEQKIHHSASFLAEHLQNGSPCPVCGSTEHPNPAKNHEITLDLPEKIRLQETVVQQMNAILQEAQKKALTSKGSLLESNKSIEGIHIQDTAFLSKEEGLQLHQILEDNFENETKALIQSEQNIQKIIEAKEKAAQCSEHIDSIEKREHSLQLQSAATKAKLDEKSNELTSILSKTECKNMPINTSIENAKNERQSIKETCELFEKQKKENEQTIVILNEKESYIIKNICIYSDNVEKTLAMLNANIHDSELFELSEKTVSSENILTIIDKIESMHMQSEKKQEALQTIEYHKNELLRLNTLYEQAQTELEGTKEDVQQKEASIQRTINDELQKQEHEQNALSDSQQDLSKLTTLLHEYTSAHARLTEKEASYELYEKLHNVISGGNLNPKKIPLDSWILGMYLQEITIYANSRLKKMSNGRYELHLKQDAEGGNAHKGLDLEIYDEYTGKSRPTASLSGGETFMTAISLALAISDIVQEQNGGVQLDSLFIDEGFGSLDAESLEKALGILDEIRETRSIGLISHVESLQNRITSQVRVNKHISGSTIEIHTS